MENFKRISTVFVALCWPILCMGNGLLDTEEERFRAASQRLEVMVRDFSGRLQPVRSGAERLDERLGREGQRLETCRSRVSRTEARLRFLAERSSLINTSEQIAIGAERYSRAELEEGLAAHGERLEVLRLECSRIQSEIREMRESQRAAWARVEVLERRKSEILSVSRDLARRYAAASDELQRQGLEAAIGVGESVTLNSATEYGAVLRTLQQAVSRIEAMANSSSLYDLDLRATENQ